MSGRAGARWLPTDTSAAQTVLTAAYLGLDDRERACGMAWAARDAAEKAGNQLDLASALSVLGTLYRLRGQLCEAEARWHDAAIRFERLGHPARSAQIRELSHDIGSFVPLGSRIESPRWSRAGAKVRRDGQP